MLFQFIVINLPFVLDTIDGVRIDPWINSAIKYMSQNRHLNMLKNGIGIQ
jgi:hypothetical protein